MNTQELFSELFSAMSAFRAREISPEAWKRSRSSLLALARAIHAAWWDAVRRRRSSESEPLAKRQVGELAGARAAVNYLLGQLQGAAATN